VEDIAVHGTPTDRAYAEALDARDSAASLRDRFLIADESLIYLDGNSLGMLPLATQQRLGRAVAEEWGAGLVRGWHDWIDLPGRVGDYLGEQLLGAGPGQVLVCDSITVNLHKVAHVALDLRPGRHAIVTDDDNFPTDRYVLEGVAQARGGELRLIASDPVHGLDLDALDRALDEDVALVSLSHVAYRSGALVDMWAVTERIHRAGALVAWDLAHSAGSVPVELDASRADFAVGCTYKYLNAGPGAPGFLYVRQAHQEHARSPIWGWFGQQEQFAMGQGYAAAPGIIRYLTGTPNVLGTYAVEEGVRVLAEAGMVALREKAVGLTTYLIALADAWLAPHGFEVVTPREPAHRGGHVSLQHPDAFRITRALIERADVVPDFRGPDRVRLGPAPATTRFVDVYDAMSRLRDLMAEGGYQDLDAAPTRVT
jgi:kynureninase